MQVYNDVFVLVDRFACVPICLINSMLMRIRAHGKIYIERVTFNTHMITKVVEYICDEDNWPAHMTKDDKIAAACCNYSMKAMDLFSSDVPRGLNGPVTYLIYELPMAAHGFVAYLLEIYLVVASELGALVTVKAFFAQFARGDGDVFDLHNSYGICNILLMLDDETFPNLEVETIDEQVTWAFDLHVPRRHMISTHGVRRVPLRLAGVGSTTSLPPQRGPSEISLRGSNYFQSPPPLRLTPQLQKMSSFSGTEMGATTLPRPPPPPPPSCPLPRFGNRLVICVGEIWAEES